MKLTKEEVEIICKVQRNFIVHCNSLLFDYEDRCAKLKVDIEAAKVIINVIERCLEKDKVEVL